MTIDKNQAVIDYLIQCPKIQNSPLFFNFINAKDDNKQFIAVANEKIIDKPYIDGSILKRYTFTIIDYKSINYNPVIKQTGYSNENIEEMFDTQGILDWITEQNKERNFPDFGEDCIVEKIEALTNTPNLNGVDTTVTPMLAKYSISVKIEYLDKSNVIWT